MDNTFVSRTAKHPANDYIVPPVLVGSFLICCITLTTFTYLSHILTVMIYIFPYVITTYYIYQH